MFRLNRNERSHWSGNGVHVESELVFMIGRNMQSCGVDISLLNEMFTSKSEPDNAKYSKDGVSWSGQGRRPDAFKGLGAVELERYRIPQKK